MSRLKGLLKQLRVFTRKGRIERELDEELRVHLEMETEKNLREGMSPAEARRAALVAFGGVERTKERVRDARWTRWVEDLVSDVRYALRFFVRSPTFTLVAVLTLGIGIGANTALYGMIHALVSRTPTGVPPSDRLVWVDGSRRFTRLSYQDFLDLRAAVRSEVDVAAYARTGMALGVGGSPRSIQGQLVSGTYFDALGVRPAAGRLLTPHDDVRDAPPVAVIGYHLWQDRFGGRSDVLGSTAEVNGHLFTVVGVAPSGFVGIDIEQPAELWVPISTQALSMPRFYDVLGNGGARTFQLLGRLRPGVDPKTAQAALLTAARRIEPAHGGRFGRLQPIVTPLRGWAHPDSIGWLGQTGTVAWIITGLVLLLACANVANLLLARASSRRREIAVRVSLGAGRVRVVRQLVTEGLVLFLGGAAVAVPIAAEAAPSLKTHLATFLAPVDVAPDLRVLAFTLSLAVASGLLFSLVPALSASRPTLTLSLRDTAAGSVHRKRTQSALVIGQVALSLVLLLTAALFLERLRAAQHVDLGYEPDHVLMVQLDLSTKGYGPAQTAVFYRSLDDAVLRLPGVRTVSGPTFAPFLGTATLPDVSVIRRGGPETLQGRSPVLAVGVAPDFFATLRVPIVRGRAIEKDDVGDSAAVALVDESFARSVWGRRDPIGHKLLVDAGGGHSVSYDVVGVAHDIVEYDVYQPHEPEIFLPYSRTPVWNTTQLLVRTAGDPRALAPALRKVVSRLDPGVAVVSAEPLRTTIDEAMAPGRTIVLVLLAFGALALTLAALGLFGVMAFTVQGRIREIAIRLALGARQGSVVTRFVHEGALLTLVGIAIGRVLVLGFSRILASAVSGLHGIDPTVAAASVALLTLIALLACWLPARKAARVDPIEALNAE